MKTKPDPLWNPYVAGVALGFVLIFSYMIFGMGVGSSSGPTRLAYWVAHLFAADAVEANSYMGRYFTTGNIFYDRMIFVVIGTLLGGLVAAYSAGRMSKGACVRGPRVSVKQRIIFAIIGGIMMGIAARIGRGCTSGQALSGGAMLSVGAWIYMMAFFGGAYITAPFLRRQWK